MPKPRRAWYDAELVGLWVLLPVLMSLDGRWRSTSWRLSCWPRATRWRSPASPVRRAPSWASAGCRSLDVPPPGGPWVAAGAGLLPLVVVALHGPLEAVNVAVFGLAHLVYGSWLSVGLSMLGRVVLVRVYSRSTSFWGVWLLHLAFGLLVFLVGLGRYFYAPLGER